MPSPTYLQQLELVQVVRIYVEVAFCDQSHTGVCLMGDRHSYCCSPVVVYHCLGFILV